MKLCGWIRINTPFIWLINRSDYTNANTELWNNRTDPWDSDCTFLVWSLLVLTPLPTHHPSLSNYGTESLVPLTVQVKLSYTPTPLHLLTTPPSPLSSVLSVVYRFEQNVPREEVWPIVELGAMTDLRCILYRTSAQVSEVYCCLSRFVSVV